MWPINNVKNIRSTCKLCDARKTLAKSVSMASIKIIENQLKMPYFAGASTLKLKFRRFTITMSVNFRPESELNARQSTNHCHIGTGHAINT